MNKDEYIKMLYQRTEYLKSEIADFEQCNGGVEQARLWAIKEQVSRIFRLIDVCDKELFPDTVRCEKTEQEYIQTCTTEQLAEFLSKIEEQYPCGSLLKCDVTCGYHSQCRGDDVAPTNKEVWVEWLKQPHKPFS